MNRSGQPGGAACAERALPEGGYPPRYRPWVGKALLSLAVLRAALAAAAIPLAPLLYQDHFFWLLVLRPAKEVLAVGGFMARLGMLEVGPLVALGIPLALLGVWHFFLTGRAFSNAIQKEKLPRLAAKVLPTRRIRTMSRLLDHRGTSMVVLGRLAIFPSSMMGATAGAFGMAPRRFFLVDGLGGTLSTLQAVGIGYLLGRTFEDAGLWVTITGSVVPVLLLGLLGYYLRQERRS